jgi:hypothetical protein
MNPPKLWVATLIRKDNQDQLDSILVSADKKYEAIEKANHEFRERDPNYWHYAYVWVEEKK